MFYRTCLQTSAALASISLLAGCGLLSDDASGGKKKIVVGTTSEPTTLDPAAAWDGSWELYRNVFQTLLSFPTGSTTPEPDAAKSCRFTDAGNRVYQCELREGLKFSNGEKLDAVAVKHSLDRIIAINDRGGPRGLLNSLHRIEADGERTVRFLLRSADATFPFVLATPAMSLVPPKKYPADKLRTDGGLTGSGPYVLDSYTKGRKAELKKNGTYRGFAERRNDAVTIRYFPDSGSMVKALHDKQLDVTYRGLGAADVVELRQGTRNDGLRLVETVGADIRYLVFNSKDPQARKPAVRRAIAQLVDRGKLVTAVYRSTAEPLYSMIPKGIAGHSTEFFDVYGEPSVTKARRILRDAGIDERVDLDLWYTTDRYGSATKAEFAELERQLEASGLFDVVVRGKPEREFQRGFRSGSYPVFGRGWFPDFPDPDNFIAPFVGENNVIATPYESPEITEELLPASRRESDRGAVTRDFERAQEIIAKDVRLLPLWQGKLYLAVKEEIGGGERALDPQTVMQLWELYRKASW
ncbi:ABC transporter substrate-binding protein [Streptomyces yaizuensis]|uniref:ABC transporter substrate-binding protein n=1 Tax=Streptomyces yaizuensis TaxID=2989713 RepID=A0ABQ5NZN4_9ACTN|nr:ABC transporter substrate-binding protein [Streptomyces sp. YSPA8]GLF95724.1 ABC transporter substrate-binding protein [Streptomyces sp. YSPA8]